MAWWNDVAGRRPAKVAEPEPEPAAETRAADPWEPGGWQGAGEAEAEPEGEEPEGEEPPEGAKEWARGLLAEQAEAWRSALGEYGFDITSEGKAVIADPERLVQRVRPLFAEGEERQRPSTSGERPSTSTSTSTSRSTSVSTNPNAQHPTPDAPTPEDDLWQMDGEKLRRLIREEAAKIAQPLQGALESQQALLGRRWVEEALGKVDAALEEHAPDFAHIARHPEFGDLMRRQLAQVPPEVLEDGQALSALALGTVAWMNKEKMPERSAGSPLQAARGLVGRQSLGPAPEAAGVGRRAAGADASDLEEQAVRFIRHFVGETDLAEVRALDAVDDQGNHSIVAYEKALKRARPGAGRATR